VPLGNQRPVKVWAFDESRFGLHTIRRRRITAYGTKAVGRFQQRFDTFYLYGMVAPQHGDGFFLGLPKLDADHVQIFLDEFAQARADTLNVVLLDNASCHTTPDLQIPDNVIFIFQPPYTPEVTPCERVWEDLKGALAWVCFANLPDLQARIVDLVRAYDAPTLRSLTAYPYIMEAINALPV
jgi:hypothetical protein